MLLIVTVVPVSDAELITLAVPGQVAGSPLVHAGVVKEDSPAGHPGTDAMAVNLSVAGLYSSAVLSATWVGAGVVGVPVLRNDWPLEPPTISTWPSSDVPLPSMRVALGPLRAVVITPPLPLPA